MKQAEINLLLAQGFSNDAICSCGQIGMLARWTPFACATFGTIGIISHSWIYMIALGMLTLAGAFYKHSIYDLAYTFVIKPIFDFGEIPAHGAPRRFGCGIGAILFLCSGIGMAMGNSYLAFIPIGIIIPLAFVAATTQWCFASVLYGILFGNARHG